MRKLFLCATLVVLAACNRDKVEENRNAGTETTTTTGTETAATQTTPLNPTVPVNSDVPTRAPGAASATQTVELMEYSIRMPQTLRAGKQTLTIVNAGKEKHGFAIEGTNIKAPDLARGDSTPLEVDLKPGTYTVYCPVEGHRGKGMAARVTVQ